MARWLGWCLSSMSVNLEFISASRRFDVMSVHWDFLQQFNPYPFLIMHLPGVSFGWDFLESFIHTVFLLRTWDTKTSSFVLLCSVNYPPFSWATDYQWDSELQQLGTQLETNASKVHIAWTLNVIITMGFLSKRMQSLLCHSSLLSIIDSLYELLTIQTANVSFYKVYLPEQVLGNPSLVWGRWASYELFHISYPNLAIWVANSEESISRPFTNLNTRGNDRSSLWCCYKYCFFFFIVNLNPNLPHLSDPFNHHYEVRYYFHWKLTLTTWKT